MTEPNWRYTGGLEMRMVPRDEVLEFGEVEDEMQEQGGDPFALTSRDFDEDDH